MSNPHVGDIGTTFILAVKRTDGVTIKPLEESIAKQIIFTKSDGTKVTKSATFVTNGMDGQIQYVTVAADLDQEGDWSYQGFVSLPAGSWHTDIVNFHVDKNL